MADAVQDYWTLLRAGFRAELQNRSNFLISTLSGVAFQGLQLVFLNILIGRFGDLGGWPPGHIYFLCGMRLVSHGLMIMPFGELVQIDRLAQEGWIDAYLVRPVNLLIQLLTRRFKITTVGDLLLGFTVLAISSRHVGIGWSPAQVVFLTVAVISGALIEGAVQLAVSAATFRLGSTRSLRIMVDGLFNTFGPIPQHVFGQQVALLTTFVLPIGLVSYLPCAVLLGHTRDLPVPAWLAVVSPLLGPLALAVAHRAFASEARRYSSAGG